MNKRERINLKVTGKFKRELMSEAANLGFFQGKGRPNFSRFCRWVLLNGNRPIDREHYDELIRLNINLIKSMTLFNQYLYHLNRERKILEEKGIRDNNKKFLFALEGQAQEVAEIQAMLREMQKITQKIYILENA